MKVVEVKATRREKTGKEVAKKLRREGLLPAVIYGGGRPEATPIAIPAKEVRRIKHHHGLIKVDLGDEERMCILKDIQYNWLGDVPIHVDFQEVTFGETLEVVVELEFVGTPVGVSEEGGVLEILKREVAIETLPREIPEKIVVDISNLHAGDALHVKDLPLPEGAKFVDSPDETVVVVTEPEAQPEEAEEEASEEAKEE
ncbi:50S ribosomal protein L25 [Thermovibrio ammonificans]|jgi:large subunit ribosomal protein L25|uniref:Large ribosomal subunit protein bL25 n=1 Tax=Thermovibrio ammonificans (strain DSM 15698 / JCM 12110 / HB-1) TaxID=648996 RepID=E8T4D5_THEA1|nr:50S ribosomal protein L25 [Thermovibrio ammonificans]ADU96270.1 ribosomal 5S rRNA E-loop binding protein Ctc/L25/TL5 [Thermovibrio ammonificans HB-1]